MWWGDGSATPFREAPNPGDGGVSLSFAECQFSYDFARRKADRIRSLHRRGPVGIGGTASGSLTVTPSCRVVFARNVARPSPCQEAPGSPPGFISVFSDEGSGIDLQPCADTDPLADNLWIPLRIWVALWMGDNGLVSFHPDVKEGASAVGWYGTERKFEKNEFRAGEPSSRIGEVGVRDVEKDFKAALEADVGKV